MIQKRESRPGVNRTADISSDVAILARTPGLHVEGAIVVDLRGGKSDSNRDHLVGRRIQRLTEAPAGAEVTLWVSPREVPPIWPLAYLREAGQHLSKVIICCECPTTVKAWTLALRGEESA